MAEKQGEGGERSERGLSRRKSNRFKLFIWARWGFSSLMLDFESAYLNNNQLLLLPCHVAGSHLSLSQKKGSTIQKTAEICKNVRLLEKLEIGNEEMEMS